MLKLRSQQGYTILELLISTAIMLTVTGAIFSLVNPAQGTSRVQPEHADLQQRARVGAEILFKDLVIAGAGPYMKAVIDPAFPNPLPASGSLMSFFAPILPYRTGQVNPDPPGSFKSDTVTIVYVPNTPAQTSIRSQMPDTSVELKVDPQPNCPMQGSVRDPLCGFKTGDSVLIFDQNSGSFDTFEITNSQSDAMHLQHRGSANLSTADGTGYPAHSIIAQVESHTYYFDRAQSQLRYYDGLQEDVPVLDNVVGVSFTYYGDPNPPLAPRPKTVPGVQNCVIDISGNPRLPVLPSNGESLIQLDPAIFRDTALVDMCGGGDNAFDPDLLRIRKIEVRIRVQTGDPTLRGTDARFFTKPGLGIGSSAGLVPDYELRYEVTPRNMNLVR